MRYYLYITGISKLLKIGSGVLADGTGEICGKLFALVDISADLAYPAL